MASFSGVTSSGCSSNVRSRRFARACAICDSSTGILLTSRNHSNDVPVKITPNGCQRFRSRRRTALILTRWASVGLRFGAYMEILGACHTDACSACISYSSMCCTALAGAVSSGSVPRRSCTSSPETTSLYIASCSRSEDRRLAGVASYICVNSTRVTLSNRYSSTGRGISVASAMRT